MHYGIDQNIASKINMQETTCSFPEYKQPLKVNSSNIICEKDLEVLLGGQALDQDNHLYYFVIDAFLNLLAKNVSTKIKSESLEWEKFEKGIESKPVKKALEGKSFNIGTRCCSPTL